MTDPSGTGTGEGSGSSKGTRPSEGTGSGEGTGQDGDTAPATARPTPRAGRVVISSVTGRPIAWDEDEDPAPAPEGPEDRRLRGDVPPHWGR